MQTLIDIKSNFTASYIDYSTNGELHCDHCCVFGSRFVTSFKPHCVFQTNNHCVRFECVRFRLVIFVAYFSRLCYTLHIIRTVIKIIHFRLAVSARDFCLLRFVVRCITLFVHLNKFLNLISLSLHFPFSFKFQQNEFKCNK